jgi:hypothetical protein
MTRTGRVLLASLVLIILCAFWVYADHGSFRLLAPLLIAGGVAGVAQSLIENKNKITLPGPAEEGQYNLGFIADVIIGMVGAFASLVVGLSVLSERFFRDPTVNEIGNQKALADLVLQIPTWVRIASFGTLTGFASRRLLPDLSNKISNMVTSAFQVEAKKQAQNQVEIARSQTELLGMLTEATHAQGARAIPHGAAPAAIPGAAPAAPITVLAAVAERYMNIHGNDEQSLALKRQTGDEMLATILRLGITANEIAAHITPQANDRDGWLVALSSLVATSPTPGDGSRLLGVARLATHDFTRYRILLAIYSLKARRLLTDQDIPEARQFARSCSNSQDPPVQRKARSVIQFLDYG